MSMITVAGLQASFGEDMTANIEKISGLLRKAAGQGAQVSAETLAIAYHAARVEEACRRGV